MRRVDTGSRRRLAMQALGLAGILTAGVLASACSSPAPGSGDGQSQAQAVAANPDLDPGTSLGARPAPDIRLTNQFGEPVTLSQFRGKVVVLAFVDSQCTTICPLTTASMLQARQLLGAAGDKVQLVGVDANPAATSTADVMAYSRVHGMVNQWDFLTGSIGQLRAVWQAYHVYVQIEAGQVDHTPALFVIDPQGREQKVYLTTMAYANGSQEGEVLASEVASLLPSHPKLASQESLAYISGISPRTPATLAEVPSGTAPLGPGRPRLVLFFATWLTETSDLRAQMTALNAYARAARSGGLPPLTAIDEAVTEPSPDSAAEFLRQFGQPLDYPVALDTTGRVADGYGVQDQPWFVLTTASGKIAWHHDGWLSVPALEAAVSKAA